MISDFPFHSLFVILEVGWIVFKLCVCILLLHYVSAQSSSLKIAWKMERRKVKSDSDAGDVPSSSYALRRLGNNLITAFASWLTPPDWNKTTFSRNFCTLFRIEELQLCSAITINIRERINKKHKFWLSYELWSSRMISFLLFPLKLAKSGSTRFRLDLFRNLKKPGVWKKRKYRFTEYT